MNRKPKTYKLCLFRRLLLKASSPAQAHSPAQCRPHIVQVWQIDECNNITCAHYNLLLVLWIFKETKSWASGVHAAASPHCLSRILILKFVGHHGFWCLVHVITYTSRLPACLPACCSSSSPWTTNWSCMCNG